MSMKTSSDPRRIYTRNDRFFVLYEGRAYGLVPSETSKFTDGLLVVCEAMPSDGGRARVRVIRRRPGWTTLTEVWRSVTIKRTARS